MSQELTIKKLETGLALGSLKALVKATAENVMLLLDTSGSMEGYIPAEGENPGITKINGLRKVVAEIQGSGHCPMIAFGGPYDAQVRFVDAVPNPDGGTPLHHAIEYAKSYGATRLVVISDGYPDLADQSMQAAKDFGGQIDVVFVGVAGEAGSVFLDAMAKMTGGKRFEGSLADTKLISNTVMGFLEGNVEPERAPIQGPGFTAEETIIEEPVDEDDDEDDDDDDDE